MTRRRAARPRADRNVAAMTGRNWFVPLAALAALIIVFPIPAHATPPGAGHGFHVPMPDQELFVECRTGTGDEVRSAETVLKLGSTMSPADLDQQIALPAPYAPVRVRQYLAQAARDQQVEPADDGASAILLAIEGKKQSFERWLVAGDLERNRLTSMVGTWRYMVAASKAERDELYTQFERERNRPPRLIVTSEGTDGSVEMDAEVGKTQFFDALNCSVKVLEFFPHFGYEEKTKKPINRSDAKENPAALVEIRRGDDKEERWVFARFPDYNADSGPLESIGVRLDCPIETKDPAPDFVLITVEGKQHEVWTRHDGAITSKPLEAGAQVQIPESNYVFSIRRFVPAGKLIETYQTTDQKERAVTAVRVDVKTPGDAYAPVWVELGKVRMVPTQAGPVTVMFGSRPAGAKGGG